MIIIINLYTYCSSLYIYYYVGPVGLSIEQIYKGHPRLYYTQYRRNKLIRPKEILLQQNCLKYKKSYKRELTAYSLYSPRGRTILSKSIISSALSSTDSLYYFQHAYKLSRPLRTLNSLQFALSFPLSSIYSAINSYYLYNYQ